MEEKKLQYKHDTDILWRVGSIRTNRGAYSDEEYLEATLIGSPKNWRWLNYSEVKGYLDNLLGNDVSKPRIDKVVYNDPATIILWKDGSKTVVKCQEGDTYNPETGFVMAYLKRMLGNDNTFNKEITKYVPAKEKPEPEKKEEPKREDQDYYKLQQERAKLMHIIGNPRMTKKEMAKLISEVVDGIDNIVMGKEAEEPKKRDTDFKVGDLVRIRSWDDMAKEFGVDRYGSIKCNFNFTRGMNTLCGKKFIIEKLYDSGEVEGFGTYYSISTDMIEKVNK